MQVGCCIRIVSKVQILQDVAPPGSTEYVAPRRQGTHSPYGPLVDDPAGHFVHVDAPAEENQPGSHGVQISKEPIVD